MALTPISNTVEFVQDTVPTTAADGDSWLDTSLTPPRLKIFDADAGGFIEPRSIQNLDAPVSAAGADLRFIGGFQLSLASFVQPFDVSGQASFPTGVTFNGDGTSMFVVGGSSASVFQYSLSTGFDIGTASFTGTSFSVSGQASFPTGVTFNGNGTSMFVVGRSSSSVFQYSLSTGFDIGTASFSGTSFDVSGQAGSPQGVTFNGDGTAMFVIGDSSDSVFQYSLSTGFDIGTASFTGTSFDISGQDTGSTGVTFNGDGTAMFVVGRSFDSVFQYLVGDVGPK